MKVTSADCKKWIVENESPDTKASDWKRCSKCKVGDATIRVFENDVVGEAVGIVEINGEITGAQEESGHIPRKPATSSLLDRLRANPVKVDFASLKFENDEEEGIDVSDLSGRIVYALGDEGLECYNSKLETVDSTENNNGDGEFHFYCGPEDKDGSLSDCVDCYKMLNLLFVDIPEYPGTHSNFPGIWIGDAENYHTVRLIPTISAKDLWVLIEGRLVCSGAVKMRG